MRRTTLTCLFIAVGVFAAGAAAAPSVFRWQVKTSPHFEILHESVWSPTSISLELEKIYASLRLDMSMFAPWMVKGKTRVYIYASQNSYLNGEFNPPRWSKGLAYFSKKTVVVYDTGDIVKLRSAIAHELSHLYFEGYFGEKLKQPPRWLNEGLAVYIEESVFTGGGPWTRALPYFSPERQTPFGRFFNLELARLGSDVEISDWYLQAYGTVLYLYRQHTRVQFKAFCEALRSGKKLETALWESYRVRRGDDFGRKWAAWLNGYAKSHSSGPPLDSPSASFNFKPVQFSSFPFSSFGLKTSK